MVHTDQLTKEYEIEVQWLAFPLHPETPEEGMTLEELFAGRNVDIPAIQQRLKRVADSLFLPFAAHTKTYNTRLAQELGKWAELQGKGDEFHHAVFRAYFAEPKNVARVDELVGLCTAVGLPADETRRAIMERSFREAVDADWGRSRALGITAVPTFVIGDERVVGFQPYDALVQLIKAAGARTKQT